MPGSCDIKTRSDLQILKDDIFIDTAQTSSLDSVVWNLGMKRPKIGWSNDDLLRAVAKRCGNQALGLRRSLEELCEHVFGPAKTKVGVLVGGEGGPSVIRASNPQNYVIVAGTSDILRISANELAPVSITLTPGAVTAATVAADINANTSLQVAADTIVVGGSTYLQLTSSGTVRGSHSIITIYNTTNSAHTVLGLVLGEHRGSENIASGTSKVVLSGDYFDGNIFPQIGTVLLDEGSTIEEEVEYCFNDDEGVLYFKSPLLYNHERYLPFAGTTLVSDIAANATELGITSGIGYPGAAPFVIIINRGFSTEEEIPVETIAGTTLTLALQARFNHLANETIELAYTQTAAPALTTAGAVLDGTLTIDDTSVFPAAEFTAIIAKGTASEETFWIATNNGTTTLTFSAGTLAFNHPIGTSVEAAQVQLIPCKWLISETKATGVVEVLVSEDCAFPNTLRNSSYIHEQVEIPDPPGIPAVVINTGAFPIYDMNAGRTTIRLPYATGITGVFQDKDYPWDIANRVFQISDGVNDEYVEITNLSYMGDVLPDIDSQNTYSGYSIGPAFTGIKITNIEQLSPYIGSADALILADAHNPGVTNIPCSLLTAHYNNTDSKLYVKAAGAPGIALQAGESWVWFVLHSTAANLPITFDLASPTKYAHTTPYDVKLVQDPTTHANFQYDLPAPLGLIIPPNASNLQDGGMLPDRKAHAPQDVKYPGPYVHNPSSHMPRSYYTTFSALPLVTNPRAWHIIPAPTEVIGYCDDIAGAGAVIDGSGIVPLGKQFLILDDVQGWPNTVFVPFPSPFPYDVQLNYGELSRFDGVVTAKTDYATALTHPDFLAAITTIPYAPFRLGNTTKPGIIALDTVLPYNIASRKTDGTPGSRVALYVSQLNLAQATGLPAADSTICLDFGTVVEEWVNYDSRVGTVLQFDTPVIFEYPHPARVAPYYYYAGAVLNYRYTKYPGIENMASTCAVLHGEDSGEFGQDGYDYPWYLNSGKSVLLSGVYGDSVLDTIRPAGIKIEVKDVPDAEL